MHPERIGPYCIEKKIGAGGMGTVYLGRHAETGQVVAVKVLPAAMAREGGFVDRFAREIDALRKLSNPHVVTLFDSGADGETYYYAMEYVEGETLTSRLIREKRIPWRETVDLSLQICSALKAAHDAGFVHRDLKPSNLLLAMDGTIKLTDFGVVKPYNAEKITETGGIIGTAEYMSPEQAQGTRATKKSDLYSLGAVMYAMLTGRPPFTGKTTLEVIHKHRYAQFDRPTRFVPDIPHWLDDIVCQLLEKEADKRFPDAYVLSRKLQELVRKVELSSSAETQAGLVQEEVGTDARIGAGNGPGEATLMRHLFPAMDREVHGPSALGRLFDNFWVLVGSLALLIAGGVAVFWPRGPDPQEKFAAGVAILGEPEGERWLTARDDYFQPLVESDPGAWQEKARPYLDRIELYEWKSEFGRRKPGRKVSAPRSEPERLMLVARSAYECGDVPRARRTLTALRDLLAGDPEREHLCRFTQTLLDEIEGESSGNGDRAKLLQESLARADRLERGGKRAEAERIWRSMVILYQDDPDVADAVRIANQRLDTTSTSNPEITSPN